MKQTLLTALLAVTVLMSTAQNKLGIFGGPQLTSSKYTIGGTKQDNTPKYGFQLGTTLKVPFENKLFFAPAAFYSLKGYKVKFNQRSYPPDSLAIDNNTRLHTFELAALLQYDFKATAGHLFVRFGPSLDFQLSGREKYNRSNGTNGEKNMVFSFTQYGRYAASLISQFGYECKNGLFLFVQYSHGIGSMNNADFGPKIWHRVVGLSVGKYLHSKK